MSNKKNRPEDNAVPEREAKNQEAEERETPPEQGAQSDAAEDAKAAEAKTEEAAPQPDDCASKLAAEHDRYLRLAAEYDNYRKRSQRERDSIFNDVRSDTVTKFLPVYDNLVRALEQSTADEAYRRGVELIMTQFNDILTKLGVTPIDALGQKFDPTLHNAVMHEEDAEKGENEIVQELQKGFKLGDKVIRFAMVKVAN